MTFAQIVGTLDGGGLSYMPREVEETMAQSNPNSITVLVEDCNHGQVKEICGTVCAIMNGSSNVLELTVWHYCKPVNYLLLSGHPLVANLYVY